MRRSFLPFRRVKNRDPDKLRVLAEDLRPPAWIDRLSLAAFLLLTMAASSAVFAGVMLLF